MSDWLSEFKELSLADMEKEYIEKSTKFGTLQECITDNAEKIKLLVRSMEYKKLIYSHANGAAIRKDLQKKAAEIDTLSQTNNNLGDKLNFLLEGTLRKKIKNYRDDIKREVKKQKQLSRIFIHRKKCIENADLKHTLNVAKVNKKIQKRDEEIEQLKAIIKQENERLNKPTPPRSNTTTNTITSSTTVTTKSPLKRPATNEEDRSKTQQQYHQVYTTRNKTNEEDRSKIQQQYHQAYTTRNNSKQQNNPTLSFPNNNNNNNNNNNHKRKFDQWNLPKNTKNNTANRYWYTNKFATRNNYRPYQNNAWKIPRRVQEIPIEESMALQAKKEARYQDRVRNRQKNYETKKELDQLRLQYMEQGKSLSECQRKLKKELRQKKEKADAEVISKQKATDVVEKDKFEF